LFCLLGERSGLAAKTLKSMGFDKVIHTEGGFNLMKTSGFKIK
jgi:rhodanese-related sulfurtransferase